jgi:hypothetical protein
MQHFPSDQSRQQLARDLANVYAAQHVPTGRRAHEAGLLVLAALSVALVALWVALGVWVLRAL